MSDLKIMYVSYVRSGHGDEVHTRQFANALRQLHGPVAIYAPRLEEDRHAPRHAVEKRASDPWREIRYLAAVGFKKAREQFRVLRREKPDLVVMRACRYLSLLWLCRWMKIPIVLEVNAPMVERMHRDAGQAFRPMRFWCRLEARLFDLADHITVVSAPLHRIYLDYGIHPAKVSVVPNGVDTRRFSPARQGKALRERLGLSGRVVIGFVGSFAAWHGLDTLIAAIGRWVREHPGQEEKIALLLVGPQYRRAPLPAIQGVVTVAAGRVSHDQVPEFMAAMDIIAAPYPRIDPFYFSPLKVFEAMAMGKAVIASSQGQIQELIEDGRNGVLYPPDDPALFARQLHRLIQDPAYRAALGAEARRTIEARYTWRDNAAAVLRICKRWSHPKQKRR